jgi:MFS family permease
MNAPSRRALAITVLIIAGEAAFLLPFILARVFRPTLLDVFGLTNLELGTAFSVYGIVAMAAYLLGGPLADKFPARIMLAIALASTGAGGLVMIADPSLPTLVIAVGFVSVIGYTPDVFMGPLMGYLLDRSPGAVGQQHVFWAVSGFALVGLVASYLFSRVIRERLTRGLDG